MFLPERINALVGDMPFRTDSVGCSGSEVRVYDEAVLKIEPCSEAAERQVQLLLWLEGKLPVPKVLCHEICQDRSYLLMSRITGEMSCSAYYKEHREELFRLLAESFRMLWRTDISDCPADRCLGTELAELEQRELPDIDVPGFENAEALFAWLKENRPPMDPVFSHGDLCMPNIFFEGDRISGFIDVGDGGVADRWRDITVCLGSLRRNFDGTYGDEPVPGFDPEELFDYLDIEVDRQKMRYYMLLNELY